VLAIRNAVERCELLGRESATQRAGSHWTFRARIASGHGLPPVRRTSGPDLPACRAHGPRHGAPRHRSFGRRAPRPGVAWYEARTRCLACCDERQCRLWLEQTDPVPTAPPRPCATAEFLRVAPNSGSSISIATRIDGGVP
jgi:hypothetical protein